MGLLNRKFFGRDFGVTQSGPKQRTTSLGGSTANGSKPPAATATVGKPGKLAAWFADFARPYTIPADRPAARYSAASNGGGLNEPAAYLNGRKIKERIDLDLSVARTDFAINIAGSVLVYADSTNGTDRINVRFATSDGDQAGPLIPFRPAQFIGGERYSRVLVSNAVIAGATATLLLVEDRPGDEFSYR